MHSLATFETLKKPMKTSYKWGEVQRSRL